jgi:hypothetical protein
LALILIGCGACIFYNLTIINSDHTPSPSVYAIAEIIAPINSSRSQQIDSAREFVHRNSVHGIKQNKLSQSEDVIQSLWCHYENKGDPPPLTCGPRARAMKSILDQLHIKSRIVHIYSDTSDQIRSHTFLEVYNKDSDNWEIQDPDLNIFYIDQNTSRKVSTADIIFGNSKTIIPCSATSRGWETIGVSYVKDYFKAVEYDSVLCGVTSIILVNENLLNTHKRYHKNNMITLNEYWEKSCVKPIIISDRPLLCRGLLALSDIIPDISSL